MFSILKRSNTSSARLGELQTNHGVLQTPFFMPDATRGVIKSLSTDDLEKLGLPAMVVNTYHLLLQPGVSLIKKTHGVHNFMAWNKPLLSDSGGYQVFSLIHKNPKLGKIYADKVKFKSPLNGIEHELTPEKSVQIQFDLGTDMIVCLDDCPPHNYSEQAISESVSHTIAWAKRCKTEYSRQLKKRKIKNSARPLLFGVIQGGKSKKLRQECAIALIKIGFDGLSYGARPIDENGKFMADILRTTAQSIPENYVRFGLGIGLPEDIVRCVKMGWDMFDCVIPTREARHGRLYFFSGQGKLTGKFYQIININNAQFAKDFSSINSASKMPLLRDYFKAYLHHLFKINEQLGQSLATINNLEFYMDLMAKIRKGIKENKF